jgi:hypothetical protein
MLRATSFRPAAVAATLFVVFFAPVASAQTFADVIPANCVLYFRDEDPIGRFEKMTGSSDVWSNPKKVSERTKRSMDRATKQADKHLEKDEGTVDGWLRSLGAIELALFSLNFDKDGGDPFPMPEFAVSFESPAAVEMFGALSKMMIDQGQATKNERGDLVLGLGFINPLVSLQNGRIIMASSEDKLNTIVSGMKSGRIAQPLSSDPTFRACVGEGASPTVLYVRFGALLQMIRDMIPERAQKRMNDIITPLGLTKIVGIGYHEEGPNGITIAKASEPIQAFKLLKGKSGPPGLLEKMPADSVFTVGRTDELGPHLSRIYKFLIDPLTFPFAKEVLEGIEQLQSSTGFKVEQMLGPLKGSVIVAGVPDEHGRFREERSIVVVAKVPTREEALSIYGQLATMSKANGVEMEQSEVDGLLWLKARKPESRPVEPAPAAPDSRAESMSESRAERLRTVAARRARRLAESERPKPMGVWTGEAIIFGLEPAVTKTLAAHRGQAPTLGTTGAFKRLPPQATFYITSSLGSMFAQENDFSAALALLKNFGNTGSSMVVEDDVMTFVSNRTGSEQIAAVLAAAAVGEDGRDERREILDMLREIGDRTKAFRENNKKWPASLAELGYTAKDMPAAKDSDGKTQAIVFLPPKATTTPDDGNELLAYFPSSDFGRLAVAVSGMAWSWSESQFLSALARYNSK